MNEAFEQKARQMLAHVFCCDPSELSKDEVRAARAVLAYQASEFGYVTEMGEAAADYHNSFKFAHPLPAQWRWHEVWARMHQAQQAGKK